MGWFDFSKKDRYAKQQRIEHRGKNLRVSRTGGVALRTQAKAAGLTITANSQHGLRVSSRVAKNTQVALQNGRPVLRGRYGSGATRLNLSKSGVSVSTRNPLGTFNWSKPNRSSVKIAGVQLRGKKAANIQLIYMLLLGIAQGLQVFWQMLTLLLRVTARLCTELLRWIANLPDLFGNLRQDFRNARISSKLSRSKQLFTPPIDNWSAPELLNASLLTLCGWGSGLTAHEAAIRITQQQQHNPAAHQLTITTAALSQIAQRLEQLRSEHAATNTITPQVITALLAQQQAQLLGAEDTVELFLHIDDWILTLGERTELQEQLLQIFADFAQLRFQTDPVHAENFAVTEPLDITAQPSTQSVSVTPSATGDLINLNTASHAQLQTLPHIGHDRALAIMTLRPISDLSQLTQIHGIGPARLADIKRAGVDI